MRVVVLESATKIEPGQTFNVQPFRLDKSSAKEATEFEITFLLGEVRYQYGFSLTSKRIVSEHLLVYKSSKSQRWFERYFDADLEEDVYEFGSSLKGPKNLWEKATRPNSLFLSMASQLNSEPLKAVFEWFSSQLVIVNETSNQNQNISIRMLGEDKGKKEICDFLTAADISINNINVETRKVPGQEFRFDLLKGKVEMREKEIEQHKILFHHMTENGEAVFDLADESSGTQKLFFLAGPVLDILSKGSTLVIDELNASLHTLLVRELVELFHKPSVNEGNAQLIFNTHDTSLLHSPYLFRRDQVWLAEKNLNCTW